MQGYLVPRVWEYVGNDKCVLDAVSYQENQKAVSSHSEKNKDISTLIWLVNAKCSGDSSWPRG